MAWEVLIRRADGSALGERDTVKHAIAAAIAGVQFYREPSGPEKITLAREAGVEFPDFLRRSLEQHPATEQADFEGDGFSYRFFLGSETSIDSVVAEIRGDTEQAMPLLRHISSQTGWVISEGSNEPFIR